MKPWLRSADPALPHRPLRIASGAAVALAVAALIALLFGAIVTAASVQPPAAAARYDLSYLLWITTLQATLSTILSLAVGIALAWALNRLRFPGRNLVVGLFASAIVTPGLIVAFGLLAVWGRNGWLSRLSDWLFGAPLDVPIFGLGGVVAAHVILDGAFAARILLARLDAIPEQRLKTGQSLALSALQRFTIIDWPAMRGTLPGLAAVIFLLAFTSFPIVLLLGGGPAVQTLEVAIYSAVRLDFDLGAAVTLALAQIGVCAAIILVSAALSPVPTSLSQPATLHWRDSARAQAGQWTILLLSLLGFGLPLLATLGEGLGSVLSLAASTTFRDATLTSLAIATASAALALVLSLAIAASRAASGLRWFRVAVGVPAYAYLAVPAVALSLGAFLFVRELGLAPERTAPLVVIVANALLALPFALATLGPAFDAIARSRGRLMRSIGLSGIRQFREVEWPLLAGDIGIVVALAFCFSLGDLGVISLFGTQDFVTLPLYMLRALGAYRTNDAAAVAALMLALTIAAFVVIPRLFERLGHARA
jgi:thiamine transport system permease protein